LKRVPLVPHPSGADRAARGLNFKSHIPLYIQLTEILKERIESGEWQPGQRFASEGEIGAEFAVSRAVVRPALAILQSDGQLTKAKGRGIFVAPAKVVCHAEGLIRSLIQLHRGKAAFRTIDVTDEDVDERLAAVLRIPVASGQVLHVMTVIEVDGLPVGVRDSYIAPLIRNTLLTYLSSPADPPVPLVLPQGLVLHGPEAEVELSSASPFESEQLQIGASVPTILSTYREFGTSPKTGLVPIEFARSAYRADITVFRLRLQ
jgi:GntR family transcriptional regulator